MLSYWVYSRWQFSSLRNKILIPINLKVIASPDIDICAVVVLATVYSNETAVGVLSRPHRRLWDSCVLCRDQLECDGTRAETRFRLSAKRTSPFKSAGTSVQSTTDSRGVRISVSNAGYTMFRGSVKGTGYPLHSPVSPSLPVPCVTVCHHVSAGVNIHCLCRI